MKEEQLNISLDKDGKLAPIFPTYDCTTDFDDESSYPVMERDEDGEYYWRKEADRLVIQQQIALFRARAKAARYKLQMFSIIDQHQHYTPVNMEGIAYPMRKMNVMHYAYVWIGIWSTVHKRCTEYASKLEQYLGLIK